MGKGKKGDFSCVTFYGFCFLKTCNSITYLKQLNLFSGSGFRKVGEVGGAGFEEFVYHSHFSD